MPTPVTRSAADADLVEQPPDQAAGERDALVGLVVDVERLLGLGEDGVREVGDGDAHVRVAEVDARRRRRPSG